MLEPRVEPEPDPRVPGYYVYTPEGYAAKVAKLPPISPKWTVPKPPPNAEIGEIPGYPETGATA